jgi:hypothetical protein
MITVPTGENTSYTILFEERAAKFVASLITLKACNDIEQVLVLSKKLDDITCINEVQFGVQEVGEHAFGDHVQVSTHFNPLYLPVTEEMEVEYDQAGQIEAIGGFEDPFIVLTVACSTPSYDHVIDATVAYDEYEIPPAEEALKIEENAKHIH